MSGMLINLIIQIVSGAIGGNVAGAASKDLVSERSAIRLLAQSAAALAGNFSLRSFRCWPRPQARSILAHLLVRLQAAALPVLFSQQLSVSLKASWRKNSTLYSCPFSALPC